MKTILTDDALLAATPVPWEETGIPLKRLAGFVVRNEINDPIGGWVDGKLFVYADWRLKELQRRESVVR